MQPSIEPRSLLYTDDVSMTAESILCIWLSQYNIVSIIDTHLTYKATVLVLPVLPIA